MKGTMNAAKAKKKLAEYEKLIAKCKKEREKLNKVIEEKTKVERIKRNRLTRRINILETSYAKLKADLDCWEAVCKYFDEHRKG